jgi:hypothetical protein
MSNRQLPKLLLPSPSAWAKLILDLGAVTEQARHDAERDGEPIELLQPEGVLLAFMAFLKAEPMLAQTGADEALLPLLVSVRELAEGGNPSLLRPFVKGRPRKGYDAAFAIGMAARAMNELMKAGERPEIAAGKVAKALKQGAPDQFSKITKATIKNWRNRCLEGDGAPIEEGAVKHFNATIPPELGQTHAEIAASLLIILSTPAKPTDRA